MSTEENRNEATGAPKRRNWLVAASVAVAVLVIGGGGTLVLQNSGDDSPAQSDGKKDSPPPLALDSQVHASAETGRGAPGIAPGEPNPSGTVYRALGELPEGPDSAPVYRTSGKVEAKDVTRLAKALGLSGTPHLAGDSWQIGGNDGQGPRLQVAVEAPGSWTFQKYAPPGGDSCEKGKFCASGGGAHHDALPTEARAKEKAAPVLDAAGVEDAQVVASEITDASRVVKANPTFDGLPTRGWTTSVNVTADGSVLAGHGYLKSPEKSASYPLLGAKRTLDELNRTGGTFRSGQGGCGEPVPLNAKDAPGNAKDAEDSPRSSVGTCEKPAKPHTATVSKAVLGLSAQYEKGRQILVPSWFFTARPAGATLDLTVTHPAVDPRFVTRPPAEAPADRPSPRPKGPDEVLKDALIDAYTVDGRKLTAHFYGGVCTEYSLQAEETGSRVTVRIEESRPEPGKACISLAKKMDLTLNLDKPLGDREVVTEQGKTLKLG